MNHKHRGTIFVEDAPILSHTSHPGDQHILRVRAPQCAAHARPGSFAHLQCDPLLPMRRPLSIMRTHPDEGWVEFLYKSVGEGTRLLARRQVGEKINMMGPIGTPFEMPHGDRPRALLLGGGVGIPPMVFLADAMRRDPVSEPFVIMGSEVPFPFKPQPSRIMIPGIPEGVIAAMPLLEDWGVPSRLTSQAGFSGCHEGFVTDLARLWLNALPPHEQRKVQIYACGPHPMLEACAALAREYRLPCQVSLEEYMACAVGGCAGCVVKVHTDQGPAMKRVCVDGPVFPAERVFPAA
ncbi:MULTISPECIES: dihydroorotate dehydrogenase electron transfer subunit [Ectothiorhodospira]|nr:MULTISPECIES: dihydroorotate dehydrogenase electron transfer subunit [Ectothiorhodospira]MCG5494589.1 dihydroorotate dehydrogenase electron transfer subunit [Ectothiorhodospira variabilis]MCG5496179.1 dihydroorotate dehydrogenase electron transfer subunit [Ectothiorhodospira variabilis]MCG5503580.1 dihydroorotate dehydrogenase electron transfer subunit [Ectothiorhodospira variabilis]MCG5506705.1 dihydroorotate dehydrogenase electron transfer subunit [Ectothiorhodospira variabilis]MCG5523682